MKGGMLVNRRATLQDTFTAGDATPHRGTSLIRKFNPPRITIGP